MKNGSSKIGSWTQATELHWQKLAGRAVAGALTALALTGCEVGPGYERPAMEVPEGFRAATQPATQPGTQPWTAPTTQPSTQPTTQAATEPSKQELRTLQSNWWTLFNDESLNALEREAVRANPDLQAAVERVIEARAASRATEAGFYPTVTGEPSATRARTSGNNVRNGRSNTATAISLPLDVDYEVDIWGRVRRNVEASQAGATASADDYGVVLQTLEADVAEDYFEICSLDAQAAILTRNVQTFNDQVQLTETQFKAGLAVETDVLQAQTQLETTRAEEIDTRRQRQVLEHTLAILLGHPPSAVSVAEHPLMLEPPEIPAGLPAELLRRRPDVAEAEQNMVQANALVGVATANFYPVVHLTGAAGYESFDLQHAVDWESRIWAIGPSVTFPIFEGGQLTANLKQAQARSLELQSTYRSTVLGAFRDVEDALVDIHLYADEGVADAAAVKASREYLRLATIQYKRGLVNYLQVIDADRTVLSSELSAAQVLDQRLASTVLLVKAIGGGWDPEQAPTTRPAK